MLVYKVYKLIIILSSLFVFNKVDDMEQWIKVFYHV